MGVILSPYRGSQCDADLCMVAAPLLSIDGHHGEAPHLLDPGEHGDHNLRQIALSPHRHPNAHLLRLTGR